MARNLPYRLSDAVHSFSRRDGLGLAAMTSRLVAPDTPRIALAIGCLILLIGLIGAVVRGWQSWRWHRALVALSLHYLPACPLRILPPGWAPSTLTRRLPGGASCLGRRSCWRYRQPVTVSGMCCQCRRSCAPVCWPGCGRRFPVSAPTTPPTIGRVSHCLPTSAPGEEHVLRPPCV